MAQVIESLPSPSTAVNLRFKPWYHQKGQEVGSKYLFLHFSALEMQSKQGKYFFFFSSLVD
jgi:hypothetical protein